MYVESRGEAGKKEFDLGTKLMKMLDEVGIVMSRSEAFIAIKDEMTSSNRPYNDYDVVIQLWLALHEQNNSKAFAFINNINKVYRDKVISVWKENMN